MKYISQISVGDKTNFDRFFLHLCNALIFKSIYL